MDRIGRPADKPRMHRSVSLRSISMRARCSAVSDEDATLEVIKDALKRWSAAFADVDRLHDQKIMSDAEKVALLAARELVPRTTLSMLSLLEKIPDSKFRNECLMELYRFFGVIWVGSLLFWSLSHSSTKRNKAPPEKLAGKSGKKVGVGSSPPLNLQFVPERKTHLSEGLRLLISY